jgi:hypothetical protein
MPTLTVLGATPCKKWISLKGKLRFRECRAQQLGNFGVAVGGGFGEGGGAMLGRQAGRGAGGKELLRNLQVA